MGLTITNSSDSAATGSLSTQEVANAAQSLLLEATASLFRDRSGHDFVTETPSSPRSISTFDDYPPLSPSPIPSLSPSADAMPLPSDEDTMPLPSDEDTHRPLNQFGKNGHGQRRRKPPPALAKPLISGRKARDLTILNSLEAEYRSCCERLVVPDNYTATDPAMVQSLSETLDVITDSIAKLSNSLELVRSTAQDIAERKHKFQDCLSDLDNRVTILSSGLPKRAAVKEVYDSSTPSSHCIFGDLKMPQHMCLTTGPRACTPLPQFTHLLQAWLASSWE